MKRRGRVGLGPSALVRLLAFGLSCAGACWPSASFGAAAAPAGSNRVLLGVATPELSVAVRRDFELSITRGLRFGGLDVVTDPVPNGAAPVLVSCGNASCFRELGAARGAGLVARALVESVAVRARESTRRNYSIKVQVFSARSGESLVERGTTCDACTSEVAAHLGYLMAMDVGQRLSDLRRPVAAAAVHPAPLAAAAPRMVASAPGERPVTVTASANATVIDTGAVDDGGPRRSRAVKIGVGVLGGLGVAAVTTGTILWARGSQST